jgi:hypothetical protein
VPGDSREAWGWGFSQSKARSEDRGPGGADPVSRVSQWSGPRLSAGRTPWQDRVT